MTTTIHKGPCAACKSPMVQQRKWTRNPKIRPGRVNHAGYGLCLLCYTRAYRAGTLPVVSITSYHPVECAVCGPVGHPVSRNEARQLRREHMESMHGIRPELARQVQESEPPLSDAEVARLRRAVGLEPSGPTGSLVLSGRPSGGDPDHG